MSALASEDTASPILRQNGQRTPRSANPLRLPAPICHSRFFIDSDFVKRDDAVLGRLIGAEPDYCDYLPDGTVVLMQPPERFINHGCDPNVYIFTLGKDRFILAMRDIAAGEELLFDYAIGIINGDWLDCRCGSPKCRGRHRSDFFCLPVSRQLQYLPYLDEPFVAIHRERILKLLNSGAGSAASGDAEKLLA